MVSWQSEEGNRVPTCLWVSAEELVARSCHPDGCSGEWLTSSESFDILSWKDECRSNEGNHERGISSATEKEQRSMRLCSLVFAILCKCYANWLLALLIVLMRKKKTDDGNLFFCCFRWCSPPFSPRRVSGCCAIEVGRERFGRSVCFLETFASQGTTPLPLNVSTSGTIC